MKQADERTINFLSALIYTNIYGPTISDSYNSYHFKAKKSTNSIIKHDESKNE